MIFDLKEVFFTPNSLSNLVSLISPNNGKIFYNNKNKIFYDVDTKEVLV